MTPTLQKLAVKNYQSLADVEVEFGEGITLIEGPSSTGKSALLRALRTLARNGSNTSFVRQGEAKSVITATFDDCEVSLTRGKSLSTYHVNGEEYVKSGVKVPEAAETALRMPVIEGQDASFSFQFDQPFMISLSTGEIARLLSTLTNAGVLTAAAREANRRKLAANTLAKQRKIDVAAVEERLEAFSNLFEQKDLLTKAKADANEASEVAQNAVSLRAALDDYNQASVAIQTLSQQLVDVPDVTAVLQEAEELLATAERTRNLLDEYKIAKNLIPALEASLVDCETEKAQIDAEEQEAIKALGTCPVCGQETGHLE